MKNILNHSYWMLMLRGLVAIVFGVLVLIMPGLTLLGLVALFVAYAVLAGAIWIAGAIRNRREVDDWWLVLLFGLVSVGAGVLALMHPQLTALVLVLVMGANALVTGIIDIAMAIRLRKTIDNEWLLIVSGFASVLFGVLVFMFPAAGALALVWLISIHAIVTGFFLLALGFRARKWAPPSAPTAPRPA